MIEIVFARAFRRHVDCPDGRVVPLGEPPTARSALDGYFELYPAVRSYVLDDAGAVRKHVAVFVDGDLVTDRAGKPLRGTYPPDAETRARYEAWRKERDG